MHAPRDPAEIWIEFKKLLKPGRIAYDVGANYGDVAIELADCFEKVYAFEPCDESYKGLCSLNNPRIEPVHKAVSDHDGTTELYVMSNSIQTGQLTSEVGSPSWGWMLGKRTVPCVKLDTFAAEHGYPDMIKIDTEGGELRVLLGAIEVLKRKPMLYIEVHNSQNGEQIIPLVKHYNEIRILRHPYYEPLSNNWWNHYFVICR
jgi:FkbM family methyltransferase